MTSQFLAGLSGCLCLKLCHETAVEMLASRAVVSSESSAEEGSNSKLTHMFVGKIQLLPGCWLKATSSKPASKKEPTRARQKPQASCSLIGKWSLPLCCILVVRSELLGPVYSQGHGDQEVGSLGPSQSSPQLNWEATGLMVNPTAGLPGFESQLCQLQLCDLEQVT